jgi:methyl-accepting chemotaxis protein
MAEQAGSAIVQIKDGAERVVNVVANNSSALVEQGVASEVIAVQVEQVAQMTEQNSEAASVVATAAEELKELAIVMKVPGSRFQIG